MTCVIHDCLAASMGMGCGLDPLPGRPSQLLGGICGLTQVVQGNDNSMRQLYKFVIKKFSGKSALKMVILDGLWI